MVRQAVVAQVYPGHDAEVWWFPIGPVGVGAVDRVVADGCGAGECEGCRVGGEGLGDDGLADKAGGAEDEGVVVGVWLFGK